MPIFEYICGDCQHAFERLIRTGETASCPACQSTKLEQQLSAVAISSDSIRSSNITKKKRERTGRLKELKTAEGDVLRHHIEEHS